MQPCAQYGRKSACGCFTKVAVTSAFARPILTRSLALAKHLPHLAVSMFQQHADGIALIMAFLHGLRTLLQSVYSAVSMVWTKDMVTVCITLDR